MLFSFQLLQQFNLIATTGIVLDIVGVVILYHHAPPFPKQISDSAYDELRKFFGNKFMYDKMQYDRKLRKDKSRAALAIKLIGAGFILQLLSNFFALSV